MRRRGGRHELIMRTRGPQWSMHWLLFHDLVDDYLERRAPLRDAHLSLAQAAEGRGELVLAGALADPPDGAVLVFRGATPAQAESFAAADPYVAHGLVTGWRVRAWTVVVGTGGGGVGAPGQADPGDPLVQDPGVESGQPT